MMIICILRHASCELLKFKFILANYNLNLFFNKPNLYFYRSKLSHNQCSLYFHNVQFVFVVASKSHCVIPWTGWFINHINPASYQSINHYSTIAFSDISIYFVLIYNNKKLPIVGIIQTNICAHICVMPVMFEYLWVIYCHLVQIFSIEKTQCVETHPQIS